MKREIFEVCAIGRGRQTIASIQHNVHVCIWHQQMQDRSANRAFVSSCGNR